MMTTEKAWLHVVVRANHLSDATASNIASNCMHVPGWDVIVHYENNICVCIVKDILKQQFSCRGFTSKKNVIQKDRRATFNTKWRNKRMRDHTVLLIIYCLRAGNQYSSVHFESNLRLQEIFTQ